MPTTPDEATAYDAEALYRTLLEQVRAAIGGVSNAAIVGIHSGGAWLAERLAADLGLQARLGTIDISFYRDDYAHKGLHPEVKSTRIDFDVEGASILLVDDVLFTGRTVRAAVNVLFDYGRPQRIMLAVLVERDGRELPVAADFAGARTTLAQGQSLKLARAAAGQLSLTIENDNA